MPAMFIDKQLYFFKLAGHGREVIIHFWEGLCMRPNSN